jgi:hypothetical protein
MNLNDNEYRSIDDGVQKRWGDSVASSGWTAVPNMLIRGMGELGIEPTEMAVLLHLLVFWRQRDKPPYPSITRIADELSVSSKTVERKLISLENKGLIKKNKRIGLPTEYDLRPLAKKLDDEAGRSSKDLF